MHFSEIFHQNVRRPRSEKNNFTFKARLVLDNAPGRPTVLNDLCENEEVIFLPLNTMFLL
jgi:hypothetical protein